ncbi:SseB family protein [Acidimangrovimonas pyrenivorans]|uniref:SseB family protein n=1 Tax=Acidimangrovimonas pyrenivorans TaxID=2030798 RepID=A0ABV7AF75_9RHOB
MTEETPLDAAHAAMTAAPEDGAARLRFYERLADGELFLLLEREAEGESLTPQVFGLEDGPVVVVFDREERLAAFAADASDAPAPYAALPGRVVAAQLAGQGIGLGINLGVAPSAMLLGPEAVDWLAVTLGHGPEQAEATPTVLTPPAGLPEALITGLDAKLARAGGLAAAAFLAAVEYEGGRRGHMLAFVDAVAGAEEALARAAAEALTFSGIDAGEMDVTFLAGTDPVAERLARVGLRFDLPAPETPERVERIAPGSDPDKPPILR